MVFRTLRTDTRRRVEEIIHRLATGKPVSLEERAQLQKYALHIPFVAGQLRRALKHREELEADGLIE